MNKQNSIPKHILLINSDYKMAYQDLQKSGCTFMRFLIVKYNNIHKTKQTSIHDWRKYPICLDSDQFEKINRFTLVRDPLSRLISCFREKIREPNYNSKSFTNGISNAFARFNFQPGISFIDFVDKIQNIPDSLADNHFKSAQAILTHSGKFELPQIIYKLENIAILIHELDNSHFQGLYKDYLSLGQTKQNKGILKEGVREYPTVNEVNYAKNFVADRYKIDIEIYNRAK